MRKIDHLVYAVPDLEKAMDEFAKKSGVRPTFGGYHRTRGTKNAVINLANGCYLEFLAIDFENENIATPRWMGVDFIESGQITRWALKSDNLAKDSTILQQYNSQMGEISGGERKTTTDKLLKWKMILPLPSPAVELTPFMCDWHSSEVHPTDSMSEEYTLLGLEFTHSQPEIIRTLFVDLQIENIISKGEKTSIKALIDTPNGVIKI